MSYESVRVANLPPPRGHVVEESPGVHREELLREAARFFGWTRLGPDIRDALTSDVDELVVKGAIREADGFLMPADGD
ncbi:hypothetical protein AB0D99_13720 [Streptomyces sp. NPDC047971]|uniref:hypothetical protein n=1 Tax=Streptomyces sp. NPDC047971 TaxID=3154499 RepID=UPI0033E8595A